MCPGGVGSGRANRITWEGRLSHGCVGCVSSEPNPAGPSSLHKPLDPVKSSSSVASRQRMGLVWPSAMETHCSGAVRAPFAPPMGVMMPLPRREGERMCQSAKETRARLTEAHGRQGSVLRGTMNHERF